MGNCNRGGSATTYFNNLPCHKHHHPPSQLHPFPLTFTPSPTVLLFTRACLGSAMEDVRSIYIFRCELGRRQFNVTYLVTHKGTKEQFTCKSITIRKLVNSNDIRRKVQIMHHLTGHRNIVELKGT
ncbi:Calcium-dependent protein kinase 3 [Spatholobus suberectus]|nr:Calcium-dependent protein kinase 3 [Spatholobus suberectus]